MSRKITEPDELRENILPLSMSKTVPPSGTCVLRIRSRIAGMESSLVWQ